MYNELRVDMLALQPEPVALCPFATLVWRHGSGDGSTLILQIGISRLNCMRCTLTVTYGNEVGHTIGLDFKQCTALLCDRLPHLTSDGPARYPDADTVRTLVTDLRALNPRGICY
jgi:hypothetical protein